MQTRQVPALAYLSCFSWTDVEIRKKRNTIQRSAVTCPLLTWSGSVIILFWQQTTDNLSVCVFILDLDCIYTHVTCSQSLNARDTRQISLCNWLCANACLRGCLYVCIVLYCTWILAYVCYPLCDQVYWVMLLYLLQWGKRTTDDRTDDRTKGPQLTLFF